MIEIYRDLFYYALYFLLHLLIAWRVWRIWTRGPLRASLLTVMTLGFLAMLFQLGGIGGYWQGLVTLASLLLPLEWLMSRLLDESKQKRGHWALITILLALSIWAWTLGQAVARVSKIELTLREWSARRPYRLLLVSDFHQVPGDRQRLETLVEQLNSLQADWIVLTGDFMVGKKWPMAERSILRGLQTAFGVYAVRGNHEIRPGGSQEFIRFCQDSGIKPLINESFISEGLVWAGLDEVLLPQKKVLLQWNLPGANLDKTLDQVNPNRPIILLAHRSKWAYQAASRGVDLMLCGHNHGGQLPPFSWLVSLLDPFPVGVFGVNGMELIVSEGAGAWDYLPMRLFSRNTIYEIAIHPGMMPRSDLP